MIRAFFARWRVTLKKGFTKAKQALERGVDATLEQLERVFNPSLGWVISQLDILIGPLQKPMQALDRTVEEGMRRLCTVLSKKEDMDAKLSQRLLEEEELPLEEEKSLEPQPLCYGTTATSKKKGLYDQYSHAEGKEAGAYSIPFLSGFEDMKAFFPGLKGKAASQAFRSAGCREMDIADNALKFGDYVKAKSALLQAEKYLAQAGAQRFYKMVVFRDMIRENYTY